MRQARRGERSWRRRVLHQPHHRQPDRMLRQPCSPVHHLRKVANCIPSAFFSMCTHPFSYCIFPLSVPSQPVLSSAAYFSIQEAGQGSVCYVHHQQKKSCLYLRSDATALARINAETPRMGCLSSLSGSPLFACMLPLLADSCTSSIIKP